MRPEHDFALKFIVGITMPSRSRQAESNHPVGMSQVVLITKFSPERANTYNNNKYLRGGAKSKRVLRRNIVQATAQTPSLWLHSVRLKPLSIAIL